MRRLVLPLALVAAVAVALVLAWWFVGGAIADGQRVATQPLDVGQFHALEVAGRAEVVLVQGEGESVTVEGTTHGRARIRVRTEGGALRISSADEAPWWSPFGGAGSRVPRVTVRFRQLDRIELRGGVRLSADAIKAGDLTLRASGAAVIAIGTLDAASLRFVGSGAVKGELAGRAESQQVFISGAGTYRAAQFLTDRAEVKVSGAGRVVVHANKTLEASISGAGAIDYLGNPEVRQRISGAGRIKRLGEREPRLRGVLLASVHL